MISSWGSHNSFCLPGIKNNLVQCGIIREIVLFLLIVSNEFHVVE